MESEGENQGAQAPEVVRTAAALVIGGELLSGKIRDENFYHLSQMLRARGIELGRVVFCPDHLPTIERDVRELSQTYDVLFTSGGVGPTHDDLTMAGISKALGVSTVVSEEMRSMIAKLYKDKPRALHELMARVPDGARLIQSGGWPVIVAKNIWILPGVPELFRSKLAVIRDQLVGPDPFFCERIYCVTEELFIKDQIDQVVAQFPDVDVGSYPKWFDPRYKTMITFDARSRSMVEAAADFLRHLLGDSVTSL